jgi:hypothetical protein
MSKPAHPKRAPRKSVPGSAAKSRAPWRVASWLVLTAALVVIGALLLFRVIGGPASATPTPAPSPTAQAARPIGAVDGCRMSPRFVTGLGLSKQAALATTLTNVTGLAIIDPAGNNGQGRLYQHETWKNTGNLGPFITDRNGYIYVAPVPLVSTQENPPELQNRVYQVDTDSQVMSLLTELPWAQPPSGANPFGVVGLAYDCETESLYATSLSGSTAGQEVGRIFQIDLKTAQTVAQHDGVDAIGVAVFNGAQGKRLYYGLARKPEVYSIALDEAGHFVGEPRREFSYAGSTKSSRNTVRRIRFDQSGGMKLNLMNFTYSLKVASERQEDELTYRYDVFKDSWNPVR